MLRKSLTVATLSCLFAMNSYGAYTEVNCSSDSVFSEYNCGQCFDGWEVSVGSNISFLDDVWVNDTNLKKIMYKEEQTMPVMHALNNSKLTKNPNTDAFWEYTAEFNALEDKDLYGYVLPPGEKVSWLKSSLWSSYLVEQTPEKGQNVWVLVFDVMSHNILENGELAMSDAPHKECVVYKSWQAYVPPVVEKPAPEPTPEPEQMTQVKTGPEMYFLLLIAGLLTWGVFFQKNKVLASIKK